MLEWNQDLGSLVIAHGPGYLCRLALETIKSTMESGDNEFMESGPSGVWAQ